MQGIKKGVKRVLKIVQGVKEKSQGREECLIFLSGPVVSLLSSAIIFFHL